jgi:hypothetical protein
VGFRPHIRGHNNRLSLLDGLDGAALSSIHVRVCYYCTGPIRPTARLPRGVPWSIRCQRYKVEPYSHVFAPKRRPTIVPCHTPHHASARCVSAQACLLPSTSTSLLCSRMMGIFSLDRSIVCSGTGQNSICPSPSRPHHSARTRFLAWVRKMTAERMPPATLRFTTHLRRRLIVKMRDHTRRQTQHVQRPM